MRFHFSIKASFIVDTLIIRAGIVSGKATFLFLQCCFLSGARTSSFCEFHLFSDGICFQIVLVVSVHQASFFLNLKYFPQTLLKAKGFSFDLISW